METTKKPILKNRYVIAAVVAVLAVIAFQISDVYVSGTWRYKITVTVETPEGEKSGSAVYEMANTSSSIKYPNLPEGRNPATIKGEAVVVDMGQRGTLFALIPDQLMFYRVFPTPHGINTDIRAIKYYRTLKSGPVTLSAPNIPTLVTFKDIKDPKTVTAVNKLNLAATFGAGVTLKDVTIEMTDEPLTERISDYLEWLSSLNGHYLHGGMTSRDAPLGLHAGHFKRGE